MNTSSIQIVRLAFLSLATVAATSSGFAQAAEPSEKAIAAKQVADKEVCDSGVRPIQRAKKPDKSISTDWTTMPSTYTHDATGQRVDQYALAVEPQSNERADFVRSGYRHTRSTLQAGFSSDNYHVTEQWGQPVRPYGEWRYPNRPFSVPYGQWGPQLPQVVVGGNQFGSPGPWGPNPGMNGVGHNRGGGAMVPNQPGMPPGWNGGPVQLPANPNGNGHSNNFPGNQFPGNDFPGNQGQWNPGNGGNGGPFGGFGVGPGNALRAGQDEYYQQAPTYHPMSADGFQSPYRN